MEAPKRQQILECMEQMQLGKRGLRCILPMVEDTSMSWLFSTAFMKSTERQKIEYTFKDQGYIITASFNATQEFEPDKWKPSDKPGYMVATTKTDKAIVRVHRPILSDDEYIERKKAIARALFRFYLAIEKGKRAK